MTCLLLVQEDELQNVELAEAERTKKNNELKIKKRDYTGYDDEEFTPGHAGMKRSLLSKYDEFLEGSKETVWRILFDAWKMLILFAQGFRLGGTLATTDSKRAEKGEAAASVNKSLLSIDYASRYWHSSVGHGLIPRLENLESADYLKEGDIGFKKPKVCMFWSLLDQFFLPHNRN